MRWWRAVTLVEVMAVMAIIGLIIALTLPVYKRALLSSEKTRCISNLHQIQIATELYREANEGGARFGDVYAMGLPPSPQPDHLVILRQLQCSLAPHSADPTLGSGYFIYYLEPEKDGLQPTWEDYALEFGPSAVMYSDPFHNNSNLSLMFGGHLTRTILGVNIDGSIVRKTGKGDWMIRGWFNR
jgi:prepilin-type N-terminal cleavage/methylation domain-containing protein